MERIQQLSRALTSSSKPTQTAGSLTLVEKLPDDKSIAIITLNSAKTFNALSRAMLSSIAKAIQACEVDNEVKVICLRSNNPKVFSPGANLKEMVKTTRTREIIDDFFKGIDLAFRYCSKPIITAVNRLALGGGFELALLSDIILASDDAKFGLPEITLGIIPGIGGTRIARSIGK